MNDSNSCPVNDELVPLERDYGPYRRGQIWADPDLDHAASLMRRLVEDTEFCRRIATAGRHTIETDFSPDAVGRRYRSRLDTLARLL